MRMFVISRMLVIGRMILIGSMLRFGFGWRFETFDLLRRERRHFPDERNQSPRLLRRVLALPRGHTGPTHAILNDVEQRAVTEALDACIGKIRDLRVHVLAHLRRAAAVLTMTGRAVILEVIDDTSPRIWVCSERIRLPIGISGNGEAEQSGGDAALERAGLSIGREAAASDTTIRNDGYRDPEHDDGDERVSKEPHSTSTLQLT